MVYDVSCMGNGVFEDLVCLNAAADGLLVISAFWLLTLVAVGGLTYAGSLKGGKSMSLGLMAGGFMMSLIGIGLVGMDLLNVGSVITTVFVALVGVLLAVFDKTE